MKRELGPTWSQAERRAGERLSQAWEEHFRAAEGQSQSRPEAAAAFAEAARVTEVSERAGAALMRYPNVVGFSEGIRVRKGKPTGERCLVVYVERKVPRDKLDQDHVLPTQVDGVPVDVVEVGALEPLPLPPRTRR